MVIYISLSKLTSMALYLVHAGRMDKHLWLQCICIETQLAQTILFSPEFAIGTFITSQCLSFHIITQLVRSLSFRFSMIGNTVSRSIQLETTQSRSTRSKTWMSKIALVELTCGIWMVNSLVLSLILITEKIRQPIHHPGHLEASMTFGSHPIIGHSSLILFLTIFGPLVSGTLSGD